LNNKIRRILSVGVVFCAGFLCFVESASVAYAKVEPIATETGAKDIMRQVFDRDDGDSEVSIQKISSCRYVVKDRKRACVEKPRIKRFESVAKDYGIEGKDKKSVSILLDPPGERGIGFLQYDYDDQDKDADQWMYFSALGKVKRIVSGNDDEPKKGSFFGSEFSYEDLEQTHLEDYRYTLLKEERYRNRDCWVIEATPKPSRAKKSNYSKSISWVDKERFIALKSIKFDRQKQKEKRITAVKVDQVDGVWSVLLLNVDNLQSRRMSNMKLESIKYNVGVDDEFLSLRTLTDGAYREARLQHYRRFIEP